MSKNQRTSARLPMQLEVEFNHSDFGTLFLMTRDLSDTGLFIKFEEDEKPPVGTTALVKLKNSFDDGEEPPTLEMEVVRQTSEGIGLKFKL